jgi:hypothetical protein
MPSKLNSEFNYRYQVEGNTPWEKIKILKGFLEGRKHAVHLERVSEMKYEAKKAELEHAKQSNALAHVIMSIEAELFETSIYKETEKEAYELNRQEVQILEKLLAEMYEIVEPTRLPGYTDEQMFELNAANEFTAMIGKEIYAEIAANGRPSPAKVRNAMSNPHTFTALQNVGLLPEQMQYVEGAVNPLKIELVVTRFDQLGNSSAPSSLFLKNNEEDNTSEKSL